MKIAVTTTDGEKVDLHFGETKTFYVYELSGDTSMKFLEKRATYGYCVDKDNHQFRRDRLDRVYEAIKDCQVLYTAKIGEMPQEKLSDKGLQVNVYQGEVKAITG